MDVQCEQGQVCHQTVLVRSALFCDTSKLIWMFRARHNRVEELSVWETPKVCSVKQWERVSNADKGVSPSCEPTSTDKDSQQRRSTMAGTHRSPARGATAAETYACSKDQCQHSYIYLGRSSPVTAPRSVNRRMDPDDLKAFAIASANQWAACVCSLHGQGLCDCGVVDATNTL